MIPLIGDHRIVFGDATELINKFKKLKAFYQSAWLQNGMNTYETLDLQFKNQLVAVKKGTAKAVADSAAAMILLKNGALFPPLSDSASPKKIDTTAVKKISTPPKLVSTSAKVASSPVKLSSKKTKKTTKKAKTKNNNTIQKPLRT
jgi:cell division protein FtsQ